MMLKREKSIDMLRGWAIVWMITAHSIFFRYGLSNGLLNTILHFSNTLCYTTFLFTFGVGLYHSIISSVWDMKRRLKVKQRIFTLLLLYYITAITSLWSYYPLTSWNSTLLAHEAWRIVSFAYYASFTEYIPSFVFFTLIFYILRNLYNDHLRQWFVGRNYLRTIGVFFIIQILSNWLSHYLVSIPIFLRPIIGSTGAFDFPILEYFIVVILGIWTATWVNGERKVIDSRIISIGYFVLIANLALSYSFNFTHMFGWIVPWINTPVRWPPSLSFLLSGLSTTYFFWILSRAILGMAKMSFIHRFLLYMGQRSMSFLIYHLMFLFIMKIFAVPEFNLMELLLFIILIPLSYGFFEKGLARIKISRYNTPNETTT